MQTDRQRKQHIVLDDPVKILKGVHHESIVKGKTLSITEDEHTPFLTQAWNFVTK